MLKLFDLFRRCAYPTVVDAYQVKGLMAKATKHSNLCGNAEGASAGYGRRGEVNAQHILAVVLSQSASAPSPQPMSRAEPGASSAA